jgi:hypothetical protein
MQAYIVEPYVSLGFHHKSPVSLKSSVALVELKAVTLGFIPELKTV